MPALIEAVHTLPPTLTIKVGDLLMLGATGGRIETGEQVLEQLGPYTTAAVSKTGIILRAQGLPNTLFLRGTSAGRALVTLFPGPAPGSPPRRVEVTVEE